MSFKKQAWPGSTTKNPELRLVSGCKNELAPSLVWAQIKALERENFCPRRKTLVIATAADRDIFDTQAPFIFTEGKCAPTQLWPNYSGLAGKKCRTNIKKVFADKVRNGSCRGVSETKLTRNWRWGSQRERRKKIFWQSFWQTIEKAIKLIKKHQGDYNLKPEAGPLAETRETRSFTST